MKMMTMTVEESSLVDPKALRDTLSCFPTGVAIATSVARNGAPIGVTISSFNSVSMDPPLVLWSIAKSAGSLPEYLAHPGFAINVLSGDQAGLCKLFSGPERDRFASLDWRAGRNGVPVINGCAATLECETHAVYDGGDHEIMVGRVVEHASNDQTPLVFGQGKLGSLAIT